MTSEEVGASWFKWLERKFTDRKVRGSNPTSVSRLPLSRLGQPDGISALMLPLGGMAAGHRKGVTAERFFYIWQEIKRNKKMAEISQYSQLSFDGSNGIIPRASMNPRIHVPICNLSGASNKIAKALCFGTAKRRAALCCRATRWKHEGGYTVRLPKPIQEIYSRDTVAGLEPKLLTEMSLAQWLEREVGHRKVRASNQTSASRLSQSRLGKPGSNPAFVLPSGGMVTRYRKGATGERFEVFLVSHLELI
ncbi:hypothetical protein T265_10664 [Opisthorchis viverrini]|uniref:Uncharacterized protein n=1 Tax=Opisthorchis viverrini TaxID=6198 RepID=A0A074Z5R7_OPIVI|nr:hypothetical protein T265_10664 [Opisthorchis viverrini]KER20877.1 hypothetical protein T265_10664 [Opisthorchis viverrini]